jgi:hypothetical protein
MMKQKKYWIVSGAVVAAVVWFGLPRGSAPKVVTTTAVANAQEMRQQPPPALPKVDYKPAKQVVAKSAKPQRIAPNVSRKKTPQQAVRIQEKVARAKPAAQPTQQAPLPSGKTIDPMANRWLADKPSTMRVEKTHAQKPEAKGQDDNSLMLIGVQMHTDKPIAGEVKRGSYYEATPVVYAE